MKTKHCSLALVLALPLSALMAGCSNGTSRENSSSTSMPDTNATVMSDNTNAMNRDADNSGRNNRDRSGDTLTSGDQGNTPADRELTQKIRKSLTMDTSYSTTAKNIKIIAVDGKVTLRGPVNSESEKSGVETLAKSIAGDGNVDDQLEVKANP